jgi:hypothetical protein
MHARGETFYIAVVQLKDAKGVTRMHRVKGQFPTAVEAQGAAIRFLDKTVGATVRAAMMVRWTRRAHADQALKEARNQ